MSATPLADSYAHCRDLTCKRAINFYYAFRLLDGPRRDAISAIYTFMRLCDDFSEEESFGDAGQRRLLLASWRESLRSALDGNTGDHPLWPAFHDTVARYRIPHGYFFDMIEGVSSDLEPRQVETFEELVRYCHQVASVAGLSLIHILGFRSHEAPGFAEKCGVAFQLTNILRDVREDAVHGRVYLPKEDLARFGVDTEGLRTGPATDAFRGLMRFQAGRARQYYAESAPLVDLVDPAGRRALWTLIRIYSRLLDRIEELNYAVLDRRVRLSALEKTGILLRGLLLGSRSSKGSSSSV